MPDKTGRFSRRETMFTERFAATGDAVYAAEKAGYSSPRQAASQNANNPAIAAECRRLVADQLATETLPAASRRHLALLNDETVTGQVLIRAIDLAYRYGLASPDGAEGKELHEMTGEELQRALHRLRQEASERSRLVIEHASGDEGINAHPGVFD
ncbi:hypothetical protein VQ045_19170 [Aurantimonas sp. E1-2-R+4]|uniref:hypothetical protein n=1 Tax=Aurantimonas sp. E1-2-R+4 TaxID=3113714 RepID=UPI002F9363A9